MISSLKLLLALGSIFANVRLTFGLNLKADPAADGELMFLGADPDSITISG